MSESIKENNNQCCDRKSNNKNHKNEYKIINTKEWKRENLIGVY